MGKQPKRTDEQTGTDVASSSGTLGSASGNGSGNGNGNRPIRRANRPVGSGNPASGNRAAQKRTQAPRIDGQAEEEALKISVVRPETVPNAERENEVSEPAERETKKPAPKGKQPKQSEHEKLAAFCTQLIGDAGSAFWHIDAHMNDLERASIEPPLASILEQLDVETAAKANALIAIPMLAVGLAGWFMRVKPTQQKQPAQPVQQQRAPMPSNIRPIARDMEGLSYPIPDDIGAMFGTLP